MNWRCLCTESGSLGCIMDKDPSSAMMFELGDSELRLLFCDPPTALLQRATKKDSALTLYRYIPYKTKYVSNID